VDLLWPGRRAGAGEIGGHIRASMMEEGIGTALCPAKSPVVRNKTYLDGKGGIGSSSSRGRELAANNYRRSSSISGAGNPEYKGWQELCIGLKKKQASRGDEEPYREARLGVTRRRQSGKSPKGEGGSEERNGLSRASLSRWRKPRKPENFLGRGGG